VEHPVGSLVHEKMKKKMMIKLHWKKIEQTRTATTMTMTKKKEKKTRMTRTKMPRTTTQNMTIG
jgi:hypothetical protein